jgi:hypothetical protein
VPASGDSEDKCGEADGMYIGRGNRTYLRKSAPAPLLSITKSHMTRPRGALIISPLLTFLTAPLVLTTNTLRQTATEALSAPSVKGARKQNEIVYWFLQANNAGTAQNLVSSQVRMYTEHVCLQQSSLWLHNTATHFILFSFSS